MYVSSAKSGFIIFKFVANMTLDKYLTKYTCPGLFLLVRDKWTTPWGQPLILSTALYYLTGSHLLFIVFHCMPWCTVHHVRPHGVFWGSNAIFVLNEPQILNRAILWSKYSTKQINWIHSKLTAPSYLAVKNLDLMQSWGLFKYFSSLQLLVMC